MVTGLSCRAAIAVVLPGWAVSALAADLTYYEQHSQCIAASAAAYPASTDLRSLRDEVGRLMDEAAGASRSDRWTGSRRPVFVRANEAKVACGKALGYLKAGMSEDTELARYACFHARMSHYMH